MLRLNFIAIKTKDEANHISALSNILSFKAPEEIDAIVYYPFSETSENIAINHQGNDLLNGVLHNFDNLDGQDVETNSGWTQYGYLGDALKFDGYDDYVSIPAHSDYLLNWESSLTLKLAIKLRRSINATGNFDYYEIICKQNDYSGYSLRLNHDNGRLRFIVYRGSGDISIYESNKSSWNSGQWYDIMVTYDFYLNEDNIKIYINNSLDSSFDEKRMISTNSEPIIIGGKSYDQRFPGTIDEVLIHNKVLEPDINHPPEQFDLVFPSHNAKLDTLNFTFRWNEAKDVEQAEDMVYKLYLSDDYTFESALFTHATDDTFYTFREGLIADSIYYWKVIASDSEFAQTECSKIYAFRTSYDATNVETVSTIPHDYNLSQNYPNPFNPTTTISFGIPKHANVIIKIFDISGREVKTLVKQTHAPGQYQITWNGIDNNNTNVPSGVYFYQIKAGEFTKILKMSLIK